MSRVDLKTNESELLKARNSILNDETTKKYVIFGYGDSGQSNSLVEEGGEDEASTGLEALVTEFNSGRYQYGLTGVASEGKGIKHVLIIWQGEGTPILRRSACAHHAKEVTEFMKIKSSVTARSEEELDIDTIMKEVDKSSKY